jgi:hypothetical protein
MMTKKDWINGRFGISNPVDTDAGLELNNGKAQANPTEGFLGPWHTGLGSMNLSSSI